MVPHSIGVVVPAMKRKRNNIIPRSEPVETKLCGNNIICLSYVYCLVVKEKILHCCNRMPCAQLLLLDFNTQQA